MVSKDDLSGISSKSSGPNSPSDWCDMRADSSPSRVYIDEGSCWECKLHFGWGSRNVRGAVLSEAATNRQDPLEIL